MAVAAPRDFGGILVLTGGLRPKAGGAVLRQMVVPSSPPPTSGAPCPPSNPRRVQTILTRIEAGGAERMGVLIN
ncbi:hypothetical protein [Acidiphilium sp. 20-67-58]|jgi:hypothetical protein|uniref:hypothetical protein n=1 Tax=Acidiphilium sp. 20-67-58 TaxID=1970291 RepID=UPI0025BC128E|nr:hypothetical protein [Acidiphilium sp. 20-67-58]